MVRTDRNGHQLWNRTHGGPLKESAFAVVETQDGGFAVVGYQKQGGGLPSQGPADILLLKTDHNGLHQWNRTYGSEGDDQAFSIVECTDGGFAIGGYFENDGDRDMFILRTDAIGDPLWNSSFGGPDVDQGFSLIEYSGGGFIMAGLTIEQGARKGEMLIVGSDEQGNHLWNRTYGGLEDDFAYSLTETNTADLVIAGSTRSFGAGNEDMWVLKVPPNSPQPAIPNLQIEQLLAFAIILATIPALVIAFTLVHRKKQ